MVNDEADAGVLRAGAAFAARRKQMGISQRELAKRKVIAAPNLIAFEKGRQWPREMSRARMEQAVRWPPGELARLRAGFTPAESAHSESTTTVGSEPLTDTMGVVTSALRVAMDKVLAAADSLPDTDSPAFAGQVADVLADLRTLETIITRAVRSTRGARPVVDALKAVRDRYDELMRSAASAPSATLGQRLYATRTGAALSVAEAADVISVSAEVVAAAECERPVNNGDRERITRFIEEMSS